MHSYGASPVDLSAAIEVLAAGKVPVHKLITHRLSLQETARGFQLMAESGECIKVIVEPHRP